MKKTAIFIALSIVTLVSASMLLTNYSNNVKYDSNKVHHGKNSFKTKRSTSIFQWLSMRFKEGPTPSVAQKDIESILAEVELSQIDLKSASSADVPRATWIGHATVLVQYQGINFLTDPHLTDYAAPFDFWAKRFTPPALTFAEMPEIDFVVISHNHYDHLDSRTVDMFGDSVTWLVPLGLKAWFLERGIATEKVIELDWWEPHQFSKKGSLTLKITFTPSVHWSKRTLWDTNKSLWGSWAVQIGNFKSWFAGDTAYDEKLFKEIGDKLGPFQLAMIPIGAYGPRYFMLNQHLDPDQAVLVHQEIRSQKSIPIHWGTFQLTHEPFLEPPELLADAMKKTGLPDDEFRSMKIGETIQIKSRVEKR